MTKIAQTKVFLAYTFQDKKVQNVKLVIKRFREQNGLTWRWDLETSNVHKNGVVSRSIVVSYGYKSSLQGQ